MSIFGPLVSTWQIEQAYIATLTTWLESYLAIVEEQNGLPVGTAIPRSTSTASVYGGSDFLAYNQAAAPAIIVVVTPAGQPESMADGEFQVYEVQVGVVVIDEDETTSRMAASLYGAAIMGAIGQRGGLGGIATQTVLAGAPKVTLPEPDKRRVHLCVTTFQTLIAPIFDPRQGPATPTPPDSPQYGGTPDAPWTDFPIVETTDLTVTGEPLESQENE